MSDLLQQTQKVVHWISQLPQETIQNSDITTDACYRNWESAVYNEPALFDDYMDIYQSTKNKDISTLSARETRAWIAFCIRQMRFQYPPYSAIADGTLYRLLNHYLELEKQEGNG